MATIASRSFVLTPTTDKYLTLAGEEYLRKLTIGNTWNVLRIGVMVAITPDGTNNLTSPKLLVGVCSANATFANTAGYTAASTTNYIGADFYARGDTGAAVTATYNAGGGNPYFYASDGTYGVPTATRRRVAAVETVSVIGGNSQRRIAVAGTATVVRRTAMYVDITKGSPNYTVDTWGAIDISGTDYSYTHFQLGFETTTPVLNGVTFSKQAGTAIACSEVAGIFDTISVHWNRSSFPMEVYAIGARRIS